MAKRYDPLRSKYVTPRKTVSWIDKRSGDTIGRPYKPKKIKLTTAYKPYKPKKSASATRARKPVKSGPSIFQLLFGQTEPVQETKVIVHEISTETPTETPPEEYDDAYVERKYQELLAERYSEDILKKKMRCVKENGCRYVLETDLTQKPLFVIGANPSTADATTDDPTVRTIKKIAAANGFDGVIILNLYPLICTDPDKLPQDRDETIHKDNLQIVRSVLSNHKISTPEAPITVWCAWGDLVKKRAYLKSCAEEILQLFPDDTKLVCVGQTKQKNPAHPLYHKIDSKLVEYQF